LDNSNLRLFEACSCKSAPKGLPSFLIQHRAPSNAFLTQPRSDPAVEIQLPQPLDPEIDPSNEPESNPTSDMLKLVYWRITSSQTPRRCSWLVCSSRELGDCKCAPIDDAGRQQKHCRALPAVEDGRFRQVKTGVLLLPSERVETSPGRRSLVRRFLMWWVTAQKNGASALGLQRVLGLKKYETAWTAQIASCDGEAWA